MRTKAITISKCSDCKHVTFLPFVNHGGVNHCDLTGNSVCHDDEVPAIPDWCPLPDAKEEHEQEARD